MIVNVARFDDNKLIAPRGAAYATKFSGIKSIVESHYLGRLVDACQSTLSNPSARPTAIQAECWAVLLGPQPADIIGVAPTGSGKTLAFLLPAMASLLQASIATPQSSATQNVATPAAAAPAAAAPAAENTAEPDDAVKAEAVAAMRATATSAFADAVKSGLSQEDAKNAARKQAKAAYRTVIKRASQAADAAVPAAPAAPEESATATPATAPLAERAVQPSVVVLAPTRELCLQVSCPRASSHPSPRPFPDTSHLTSRGMY